MGRANPIYNDVWGDPDFGNWDPFQKLLFLLLCTHPHSATSGIYVCSVKSCNDLTGLPKKLVRHYLGVQRLSREELRDVMIDTIDDWFDNEPEPFRNIKYNAENQTVFVRNLLSRMLGGSPEKVAISIMGDHRRTYRSDDLWREFAKRYKGRLTNPDHKYYDAVLSRYMERVTNVKFDAETPDALPDDLPVHKPRQPDVVNYDTEITEMLNRYSIETDQGDGVLYRLDKDDRDLVFRVVRYITTNIRTGTPLDNKRVHGILKRLHKEPTMMVARSCWSFVDADCMNTGKRANYLFGIIRNSALSWFIEWKRELEKKGECKIGSSRTRSKTSGAG